MEAQLHHTHGHHHDQYHPAGVHEEDEHGVEKKHVIDKVKAKVHRLKATIKHGNGHHDEETMNDSPAVRSGLVEPTDMGKTVLVEDLYAHHSDILDTPVRSFAQWEEEEREGAPPPLSTGLYGTHPSQVGHNGSGQDVNREPSRGGIERSTSMEDTGSFAQSPPLPTVMYETHVSQVGHHGSGQDVNWAQSRVIIGKSTGMEEDPSAPRPTTAVSPTNHQTKVTDPTMTGGKEAGITGVLRSFDKMGIYDESHSKPSESGQNKPNVCTGSHDQFAPEPVQNAPLNSVTGDPSSHSSSYTEKITPATSVIADKAAAAKDLIVSKLGSSSDNKSEPSTKADTKSSLPMNYAHKVADTVTGTLSPVYEKVVGGGRSVVSKMQRSGEEEKPAESKGVWVKDYLADALKPGDEDKVLSETITHAFHRGKGQGNAMRDEGEGRRLQDSTN